MLVREALLKSECPNEENSLPDHQILLSLAPADTTGQGLRISVKIKPKSLEIVGRPKFSPDLIRGFSVVSEGARSMTKSIMKSLEFE